MRGSSSVLRLRAGAIGTAEASCKGQSPLRLWDRPTKFGGGFDPLLGDGVSGGEGVGLGGAVGHAAGQLGDLGDEGLVVFAPVDDDFVFHGSSPRPCLVMIPLACLT